MRFSLFLNRRLMQKTRLFNRFSSWIFIKNLYCWFLSLNVLKFGNSIETNSKKSVLILKSVEHSPKKWGSSSILLGQKLQCLRARGLVGLVCLPLWMCKLWSESLSFDKATRCFRIFTTVRYFPWYNFVYGLHTWRPLSIFSDGPSSA